MRECKVSSISRSSTAILSRLVARDLDICALRDAFNGRTVLHAMVESVSYLSNSNWQDRLIFFVDTVGVDIDAVDFHGATAIQMLARTVRPNGLQCLEFLIALGANVHQARNKAICYRNGRVLSACLAAAPGRDPYNRRYFDGKTLYDTALENRCPMPNTGEIDASRRRIAKMRLDLVRQRALQVCVGLQSLGIDALCMCEILMHSCGSFGSLIDFHQWWAIATLVKHFRRVDNAL